MSNRDEFLKQVKTEAVKLGKLLNEVKKPMSVQMFKDLLKKHNAALDKAKIDPIANLKTTMISITFVNKCDPLNIRFLTHPLGEEDINLSLLVNIENELTKRFQGKGPSLIKEIKDILYKNKEEKVSIENINVSLRTYATDHFDSVLYNIIAKKPLQLTLPPQSQPKPEEGVEIKKPEDPLKPKIG